MYGLFKGTVDEVKFDDVKNATYFILRQGTGFMKVKVAGDHQAKYQNGKHAEVLGTVYAWANKDYEGKVYKQVSAEVPA